MLNIKSSAGKISGKVHLPVSKSLMNRYVILKKMAGGKLPEKTTEYPNDVNVMIDVLGEENDTVNVQDAGTVMRFATAFFSISEGERIVRGEGRMHERPIGILVDALRELGADITYLEKEGFPPLRINGKRLKGGHVNVPSDVSSQFISALLMIAPHCSEETIIELSGEILSRPYIDMTVNLMSEMGIDVKRDGKQFKVGHGKYLDNDLPIEKDWSSASFFYQIAALSEESGIEMPGLKLESMQGDKACADVFRHFGVITEKTDGGLKIKKELGHISEKHLTIDFTNHPDLFQPIVMTALGLGIELQCEGLYNLHLKESDRIMSVKEAVENFGGQLITEGSTARLSVGRNNNIGMFKSFNDHRMAMSIAPLALILDEVKIENEEVVSKSFPHFWNELENLSFKLIENR